MCDIFIFGGTTEGRVIAEWCVNHRIRAFVSVATYYGSKLLPKSEYLKIFENRLNSQQMVEIFTENKITLVIDATHPYAVEASKNIFIACNETKIKRFRIVRKNNYSSPNAFWFENVASIVNFLNQNNGNVLITTGSKKISRFCKVERYPERCIVRILDVPEIVEQCKKMGFRKIIAERGPFSIEQNSRHIHEFSADFIVTKDSGEAGGFNDKLAAAELCGVVPLIIKRPEEEGITIDEIMKILEKLYYE